MARVVVIGGSVAGLATALLAARRGHRAVVFEQDEDTATGDLDTDFGHRRARAPQTVQPHNFLAPVRAVLRAEAPDVFDRMLALGAHETHEFAKLPFDPPLLPGDENLITTHARRIVLETALAEAVRREPGITLRTGVPVTGLTVSSAALGVPHVMGVRTADGDERADLVVDAAGRRSPVPRWLVAGGARPPVVDSQRIDLMYACRWYRASTDLPMNAKKSSAVPFAQGIVFPGEGRVFALAVCVPVTDPTRGELRSAEVFEAVVRSFPTCAAWRALGAQPITPVHVMAGLDNRWTAYADGEGPIATGIAGVGDSVTHTNPTLGQGCAQALLTAQRLAAAVDGADDPVAFAAGHHRWTSTSLKPWFDHQKTVDARVVAGLAGAGADRFGAAVGACAGTDVAVLRAKSRVRHLVATPDIAYAEPEVRACLDRWLAENPGRVPPADGPTRAEWERITS